MGNARLQTDAAPPANHTAGERKTFKVPVIVIMGRNELHTPYEPAKDFFETIEAPRKHFITLERSHTSPCWKNPACFC